MRLGVVVGCWSISMLVALSGWAQEAPAEAAPPPPPPPAGYPPPPGYPPPGYEAPPEERTANNAIYGEGLGPGLLYSVNYDRTFGDFAGRLGFGYVSLSSSASSNGVSASNSASLITVPITLSYIGIGSKKHMFEIGGGVTVVHLGAGATSFAADDSKTASGSANFVLGDVIVGYRLQPPGGGFLLRAGLSPIIGAANAVLPWPYLALGGCF